MENNSLLSPTASRPMLGIWFGNFFEPFYSDREKVRRGIEEIAELGFTSVNLDSKPWLDFFARYRGEEASPYVAMQEFMMTEAAARGLDYTHLALYLCGDNLYPTIRDVPPVRGEESVLPNGELMGTYKYWSPQAQQSMVEHVRGLLNRYGAGMHRRGSERRIVMQTMFDPIPKPSFDPEGKDRYLRWLESRYDGNVKRLNEKYQLSAQAFAELQPNEYWLRPEELSWVECARPSAADFARRSPEFWRWIDNQTYLAGEMEAYFAAMKRHWRDLEPALWIEPVLHQWGFFFNPPGQSIWPTAKRALDVYRLAPYVDGVLYITSPLNAENRADAMVLSVEGSILRNANAGRSFTGGLYLGRHVNGDLYRVVPPAEAIGTLIAAGAGALHTYGYSGLDDGGVLFRMDDLFKDSLRDGNRWAAEVIPRLTASRAKEMAVLFPAEMSLYEPLDLDPEGRHRMDLLGWYTQLVDLGWHVDILHPDQVKNGGLAEYRALVIPHNSLYDLGENEALETAVKAYVTGGGTVLHGPHCLLAARTFGIAEEAVPFDCIDWKEQLIPHGWSTVAYSQGRPLGTYIQSGKAAMTELAVGFGRVVSFGFQYGHAYVRSSMPIVPPNYGRREMHPVVLLTETPVFNVLGRSAQVLLPPRKGVECARFGDRLIVVNHRASPVELSGLAVRHEISQIPCRPGWLAGHAATYVELAD